VWFAERRDLAQHRAEFQARQAHDDPVILPCEINLEHLRRQYGGHCVHYKHRCLAVDAPLPAAIVRKFPVGKRQPMSPVELSEWMRQLLFASRQHAPGKRHPGILALSNWIKQQLKPDATRIIPEAALVLKARELLPEYFEGSRGQEGREETGEGRDRERHEEDQALEELFSEKPRQRTRGLQKLARLQAPDLFDCCTMCLEDDILNVQVVALRVLQQCDVIDEDRVKPFTEAHDRRLRGAAIAALAVHAEDRAEWLRRGLTDPSVAVRREVAGLLPAMDAAEQRPAFDLARHDPNPDIRRLAERLVQGKGFEKTWHGKRNGRRTEQE
jgi:hypothetical protein